MGKAQFYLALVILSLSALVWTAAGNPVENRVKRDVWDGLSGFFYDSDEWMDDLDFDFIKPVKQRRGMDLFFETPSSESSEFDGYMGTGGWSRDVWGNMLGNWAY